MADDPVPAARTLARAGGVLVGAAVVGGVLAVLKGTGLDARYVLGNSSAAYVLLPFLAGLAVSGRRSAAVLGIGSIVVALTSFYWTASAVFLGRLSIDMSIGRWYVAGTACGALLGLIGHAARRRPRLLLLAPALLILEPAATLAAAAVGRGGGAPLDAIVVAGAVEIAAGLALLLLVRRRA